MPKDAGDKTKKQRTDQKKIFIVTSLAVQWLSFQCKGARFQSLVREQRFHLQCSAVWSIKYFFLKKEEKYLQSRRQEHLTVYVYVLVAQLCLALCRPMDGSPPGSSVHGIFQARILEWQPFPSPGDLPDPGSNPGLLHCRRIRYPLSHQGPSSLLLPYKSRTKNSMEK